MHQDGLQGLRWPLLPLWAAVPASMCGHPLLSRPCGLAACGETVLALTLLFSLR